jgi:hypothetical protein
MLVFLLDRVIQEEGEYVYIMHNIVEIHFCFRIAPLRSRPRVASTYYKLKK